MDDIAKVTEDTSIGSEGTAISSAKCGQSARRKHWIWPMIITVLVGIALTTAIYPMPASARTFVALSAVAGALIVGGLLTLIVIIPAAGSNPEVKTEFYSARAAYLCVIAGLALLGIVAIGAVFARVMLNVGGH